MSKPYNQNKKNDKLIIGDDMLEIDIDSKMGILFVRLFGKLTKETRRKINDEVITLINKVGIQNIVLNIQNLNLIDESGIKTLEKCYRICNKSYICANPNQLKKLKKLNIVTDEMTAVNLISA